MVTLLLGFSQVAHAGLPPPSFVPEGHPDPGVNNLFFNQIEGCKASAAHWDRDYPYQVTAVLGIAVRTDYDIALSNARCNTSRTSLATGEVTYSIVDTLISCQTARGTTTSISLTADWTACKCSDSTTHYDETLFVCVPGRVPPLLPVAAIQIFSTAKPLIPSASSVVSGKVLTHQDLTVSVTLQNSGPLAGMNVSITSNQGTDTIKQPAMQTGANGVVSASVETRDQAFVSSITGISSPTPGTGNGNISWLPATYQNKFLVTCYKIANENANGSTPLVENIKGLPAKNRYRKGFLADVRMQGSGQTSTGSIIHYDGNDKYSIQSCALTAKGVCAVDGATIAVDPNVVPMLSTVAIDTVGNRLAQDKGKMIRGNHIDVYFGARAAECTFAGRRNLSVDFLKYK